VKASVGQLDPSFRPRPRRRINTIYWKRLRLRFAARCLLLIAALSGCGVGKISVQRSCETNAQCPSGLCGDGACFPTVCSGSCAVRDAATGNCRPNATSCTGSCATCVGSGTEFNCSADVALCTNTCDMCSGSGTSFGCSADPECSIPTYYVSNLGDDANLGTTPAVPWKTLARVNAATLAAGDTVLLRRGEIFTEQLISPRSSITFGAYGTGAKPVISGFRTVTGWIEQANGIYSAPWPADANSVTVDGAPTPMGRYPKTEWLTFESFVGTTSIADNQLVDSPNWTGAEVVIKKNNWTIDRNLITEHRDGTITYASGSTYSPVLVNGVFSYFLQRSANALTEFGDWYSTGEHLFMYFGANNPSDHTIKASVIDKLIDISYRNSNTFKDLSIEGSNNFGVYIYLSENIFFQNCDFTNHGDVAFWGGSSNILTVDGCTFDNTNGIAMNVNVKTTAVRNCHVNNSGMIAGMGNKSGASYYGLKIRSADGIIENNVITNSGYIPIIFSNNNIKIRHNKVDNFCNLLTDGAGIYTYIETTNPPSMGQEVYNNIVMNGGANGLYSDGVSNHVSFYNNTIMNMAKNGIHMNNPTSNLVYNNTFYNCTKFGMSIQNLYQDTEYWVMAAENSLYGNLIVQGSNTQGIMELCDGRTYSIGGFGTSDNNTFIVESDGPGLFSALHVLPSYSVVPYDLTDWRVFSGQEANSTLIPTTLSDVQLLYNDTSEDKVFPLDAPMTDAEGVEYESSVTLAPFSSIVLLAL